MEKIGGTVLVVVIYLVGIGFGKIIYMMMKKNKKERSYWEKYEIKDNNEEMF